MSQKHLVYISHIISQLSYKWLSPISQPYSGAFNQLPDLANMRQRDWQSVLDATRAHWEPYLPQGCRDALLQGDGRLIARAAMEHLHLVGAAGAELVLLCDSDYPAWLKHIPDAPLCLTILGDRKLLKFNKVGIIGSRRANGHGLKQSFRLGTELAKRHIAVVSGGALGCDIASHQGVLESGLSPAPAICVLAGGLHEFYPRKNAQVFNLLRKRHALFVSERLWWSNSRPADFRARNRIIAGLNSVTAVMQAGEKSGALITATYALEQGRELVCLIHEQNDVRALGSLALIGQGAKCFADVEGGIDVLVELSSQGPDNTGVFSLG